MAQIEQWERTCAGIAAIPAGNLMAETLGLRRIMAAGRAHNRGNDLQAKDMQWARRLIKRVVRGYQLVSPKEVTPNQLSFDKHTQIWQEGFVEAWQLDYWGRILPQLAAVIEIARSSQLDGADPKRSDPIRETTEIFGKWKKRLVFVTSLIGFTGLSALAVLTDYRPSIDFLMQSPNNKENSSLVLKRASAPPTLGLLPTEIISQTEISIEAEITETHKEEIDETEEKTSFAKSFHTSIIEKGSNFYSTMRRTAVDSLGPKADNTVNGISIADIVVDGTVKSLRLEGIETRLVYPGDTVGEFIERASDETKDLIDEVLDVETNQDAQTFASKLRAFLQRFSR